jgi:hypothetical protein
MFPNFYLGCGSCFLGHKSLGVCNNTWLLMCFHAFHRKFVSSQLICGFKGSSQKFLFVKLIIIIFCGGDQFLAIPK